MRVRLLAITVLVPASAFVSCASVERHFEPETWSSAARGFTRQPGQWIPTAAAVVATPLAMLDDKGTSAESIDDHFFNTTTGTGDNLALLLGLGPIALGAAKATFGAGSQELEVSAEAVALTAAQTQILKLVINRERPDGTTEDSFPSGHTSFAFAGATIFARWYEAEHDGSWLGYLTYLPASYVGLSRLEGDRHYLSDITFGAALGITTAHLVWNAHFGDESSPGLFGQRVHAMFAPVWDGDRIGLGLTLSF